MARRSKKKPNQAQTRPTRHSKIVKRKLSLRYQVMYSFWRSVPYFTTTTLILCISILGCLLGIRGWNALAQTIDVQKNEPKEIQVDSSTPSMSHAFQGELKDPLTDLQYHRGRWYDPNIGQWISPDTAFDFPANFGNPYSFVGQNPVDRTDPTGLLVSGNITETQAVQVSADEIIAIQAPAAIETIGYTSSLTNFVGSSWVRATAWASLGTGGAGLATAPIQALQEVATAKREEREVKLEFHRLAQECRASEFKCKDFVKKAVQVLQRRGKREHSDWQVIAFLGDQQRLHPNILPKVGFGLIGMAALERGLPASNSVSMNWKHAGIILGNKVHDNNVPWGVTEAEWVKGYTVTPIRTTKLLNFAEAEAQGYGRITKIPYATFLAQF